MIMFKNKFFVSFVLVLVFLLFLGLSSVSADEYYFSSSNITNDSFQGVIDNSTPDEVIINLDDGDYSLGQINITRNATIVGKSSSNVKINGSGILFNITSSNVKLINLTITGYTSAIIGNSSDLTVTGNNITTSGISINISSSGGNLSNILIEDNFIVSSVSNSDYGDVFVNGTYNSDLIVVSFVSFINNSIRGNGTSNSNGVRINSKGINNLTFDGNNITGTYGVSLDASSSNNTNITFANNNITGTSGYGVYLGASSSNNTNITFSNNNITGIYASGVYLDVSSSNNTNITFANNNITGTSGNGVSLYAYSSNNTNITFSNNNITGTYYGVELYAYSSNNTNITFANNNITGVSYGVYVRSYDGNVSGVLFLNNTINATSGSGFYFVNDGIGAINVTDFIIRGNNIFATNAGLNFNGLKNDSLVNVTVEYNRILAPVGVNITGFDNGSSFDYNWWGVNDITGKILGIDTVNHYILNITNLTSLDNLHPGDNVSFAFLVLNTSLVNEGVEYLPYFVVNGTYNNQTFVVDNFSNFTDDCNVSNVGTNANVFAATLDSQDVNLTFSAKLDTNSTIVIPGDVKLDETITISGKVYDENNNGLSEIQLKITVDNKSYHVTTDSIGFWNLKYKPTRTGQNSVKMVFNGNTRYFGFVNGSSFNVSIREANIKLQAVSKTIRSFASGKKLARFKYSFKNFGDKVGSKTYKFKINSRYTLQTPKTTKNIKYSYNKKTRILKVVVKNLNSADVGVISYIIKRNKPVYNGRNIRVSRYTYTNYHPKSVVKAYSVKTVKSHKITKIKVTKNTAYVKEGNSVFSVVESLKTNQKTQTIVYSKKKA